MTDTHYKTLQNKKNVRNDLFMDLHTLIPTSSFKELMKTKQKSANN